MSENFITKELKATDKVLSKVKKVIGDNLPYNEIFEELEALEELNKQKQLLEQNEASTNTIKAFDIMTNKKSSLYEVLNAADSLDKINLQQKENEIKYNNLFKQINEMKSTAMVKSLGDFMERQTESNLNTDKSGPIASYDLLSGIKNTLYTLGQGATDFLAGTPVYANEVIQGLADYVAYGTWKLGNTENPYFNNSMRKILKLGEQPNVSETFYLVHPEKRIKLSDGREAKGFEDKIGKALFKASNSASNYVEEKLFGKWRRDLSYQSLFEVDDALKSWKRGNILEGINALTNVIIEQIPSFVESGVTTAFKPLAVAFGLGFARESARKRKAEELGVNPNSVMVLNEDIIPEDYIAGFLHVASSYVEWGVLKGAIKNAYRKINPLASKNEIEAMLNTARQRVANQAATPTTLGGKIWKGVKGVGKGTGYLAGAAALDAVGEGFSEVVDQLGEIIADGEEGSLADKLSLQKNKDKLALAFRDGAIIGAAMSPGLRGTGAVYRKGKDFLANREAISNQSAISEETSNLNNIVTQLLQNPTISSDERLTAAITNEDPKVIEEFYNEYSKQESQGSAPDDINNEINTNKTQQESEADLLKAVLIAELALNGRVKNKTLPPEMTNNTKILYDEAVSELKNIGNISDAFSSENFQKASTMKKAMYIRAINDSNINITENAVNNTLNSLDNIANGIREQGINKNNADAQYANFKTQANQILQQTRKTLKSLSSQVEKLKSFSSAKNAIASIQGEIKAIEIALNSTTNNKVKNDFLKTNSKFSMKKTIQSVHNEILNGKNGKKKSLEQYKQAIDKPINDIKELKNNINNLKNFLLSQKNKQNFYTKILEEFETIKQKAKENNYINKFEEVTTSFYIGYMKNKNGELEVNESKNGMILSWKVPNGYKFGDKTKEVIQNMLESIDSVLAIGEPLLERGEIKLNRQNNIKTGESNNANIVEGWRDNHNKTDNLNTSQKQTQEVQTQARTTNPTSQVNAQTNKTRTPTEGSLFTQNGEAILDTANQQTQNTKPKEEKTNEQQRTIHAKNNTNTNAINQAKENVQSASVAKQEPTKVDPKQEPKVQETPKTNVKAESKKQSQPTSQINKNENINFDEVIYSDTQEDIQDNQQLMQFRKTTQNNANNEWNNAVLNTTKKAEYLDDNNIATTNFYIFLDEKYGITNNKEEIKDSAYVEIKKGEDFEERLNNEDIRTTIIANTTINENDTKSTLLKEKDGNLEINNRIRNNIDKDFNDIIENYGKSEEKIKEIKNALQDILYKNVFKTKKEINSKLAYTKFLNAIQGKLDSISRQLNTIYFYKEFKKALENTILRKDGKGKLWYFYSKNNIFNSLSQLQDIVKDENFITASAFRALEILLDPRFHSNLSEAKIDEKMTKEGLDFYNSNLQENFSKGALFRSVLVESLGEKVLSDLGIEIDKSKVTPEEYARITSEISTYIIQALVKAGYLEEHTESAKNVYATSQNSEASIYFYTLDPNLQTKNYYNVVNDLRELAKALKVEIDIEGRSYHFNIKEAKNNISKVQKIKGRKTAKLSKSQIDFLEKLSNTKYITPNRKALENFFLTEDLVSDGNGYWYSKNIALLRKSLGYIEIEENEIGEIKKLPKSELKSIQSKNREINQSINAVIEFLKDENTKNGVYFTAKMSFGRIYYESNTINPQTNKLHRFLFVPEDAIINDNFEVSNGQIVLNDAQANGLAQAFGYKTDKKSANGATELINALVNSNMTNEDLDNLFTTLLSEKEYSFKYNNKEYTLKLDLPSHAFNAIQNIKVIKQAHKEGKTSFENSILAEADGITNGSAIKQMTTSQNPDIPARLLSTGIEVVLNSSQSKQKGKSIADIFDEGKVDDTYVSFGKLINDEISNYDYYSKNGTSLLPEEKVTNVLDFTKKFFNKNDGKIVGEIRDVVKYIIMPFQYGSGAETASEKITEYYFENIKEFLNSIEYKDDEKTKNLFMHKIQNLNAVSDKKTKDQIEILLHVASIIIEPKTEGAKPTKESIEKTAFNIWKKFWTEDNSLEKMRFKTKYNDVFVVKNGITSDGTYGKIRVDTLFEIYSAYMGEALKEPLNKAINKMLPNNTAINENISQGNDLHAKLLNKKFNKLLEEKKKDREKKNEKFTQQDLENIYKQCKDEVDVMNNPTATKNEKDTEFSMLDLQSDYANSNENSKKILNTAYFNEKGNLSSKKPINFSKKFVSTRIAKATLGNILNDGQHMVETFKEESKLAITPIHDAMLGNSKSLVGIAKEYCKTAFNSLINAKILEDNFKSAKQRLVLANEVGTDKEKKAAEMLYLQAYILHQIQAFNNAIIKGSYVNYQNMQNGLKDSAYEHIGVLSKIANKNNVNKDIKSFMIDINSILNTTYRVTNLNISSRIREELGLQNPTRATQKQLDLDGLKYVIKKLNENINKKLKDIKTNLKATEEDIKNIDELFSKVIELSNNLNEVLNGIKENINQKEEKESYTNIKKVDTKINSTQNIETNIKKVDTKINSTQNIETKQESSENIYDIVKTLVNRAKANPDSLLIANNQDYALAFRYFQVYFARIKNKNKTFEDIDSFIRNFRNALIQQHLPNENGNYTFAFSKKEAIKIFSESFYKIAEGIKNNIPNEELKTLLDTTYNNLNTALIKLQEDGRISARNKEMFANLHKLLNSIDSTTDNIQDAEQFFRDNLSATALNEDNVISNQETLRNWDKSKGREIDEQESSRLKNILTSLMQAAKGVLDGKLLQILESSAKTNGGWYIDDRLVVIRKSTLTDNYQGYLSAEETYAHEMVHAFLSAAINKENNLTKDYTIKLIQVWNEFKSNMTAERLATHIKQANPNMNDAKALEMANAIFDHITIKKGDNIDIHASLNEFLALALTNKGMNSALASMKIEESKNRRNLSQFLKDMYKNGPMFEITNLVFDLIQKALSFFSSKYKTHDNMQSLVYSLAIEVAKANAKVDNARIDAVEAVFEATNKVIEKSNEALSKKIDEAIEKINSLNLGIKHKLPTRGSSNYIQNAIRGAVDLLDISIKYPELKGIVKGIFEEIPGFGSNNTFMSVIKDISEMTTPQKIIERLALMASSFDKQRNDIKATTREEIKSHFKNITIQEDKDLGIALLRTDFSALSNYDMKDLASFIDEVVNGNENPKLLKETEAKLKKALKEAQIHNNDGKITQLFNLSDNLSYHMITQRSLNEVLQSCVATNTRMIMTQCNLSLEGKHNQAVIDAMEEYITAKATIIAMKEYPNTIKTLQKLMKEEPNGVKKHIQMAKRFKELSYEENFSKEGANLFMAKGYMWDSYAPHVNFKFASSSETKQRQLYTTNYKKTDENNDILLPNGIKLSLYVNDFLPSIARWNSQATRLLSENTKGISILSLFTAKLEEGKDMQELKKEFDSVYSELRKNYYQNLNKLKNKDLTHKEDSTQKVSSVFRPVFGPDGKISDFIYVLPNEIKERSLGVNTSFTEAMSEMYSREFDKKASKVQNIMVADYIFNDYTTSMEIRRKQGISEKFEFIEITPNSKDPYIREIYKLMPREMRDYLQKAYAINHNKGIMVRKDLLAEIFGQRDMSIRNTDWYKNSSNNRILKNTLLLTGEFMRIMAKVWKREVVMRLPNVVFGNVFSNFMICAQYGINPKKLIAYHLEANRNLKLYEKNYAESMKIKAAINSETDPKKIAALKEKEQIIEKMLKANPTTELMQAGIGPGMSELEELIDRRDLPLNYLERKYEEKYAKAPRWLQLTQDTLFLTDRTKIGKLLTDFVQKSDYLSRYALYKALKEKGMNKEEAMKKAIDLFINYDKPTSKWLKAMSDHGLLLFPKYVFRVNKAITTASKDRPVSAMALIGLQLMSGMDFTDMYESSAFVRNWGNMVKNPFEMMSEAYFSPALISAADQLFDTKKTLAKVVGL